MKNRKLAALLAAAAVSTIVALPILSGTMGEGKEPAAGSDSVKTEALEVALDGGDLADSATGLEKDIKLSRENGKYVNLQVENKGSVAVIATINGGEKRTFEPGDKGHIYVEVTQGSLNTDQSYTFKVAPVSGSATFRYDIAQRDYQ